MYDFVSCEVIEQNKVIPIRESERGVILRSVKEEEFYFIVDKSLTRISREPEGTERVNGEVMIDRILKKNENSLLVRPRHKEAFTSRAVWMPKEKVNSSG
ncbi:MAG: hypothetical protein ABEI53_02095 [Candidatus Magasanikbacteria bacterium]